MWISRAEPLFGPRELCYALAIELGSPIFNAGHIPSIQTLFCCREGLMTVDKEASSVRLIYFSLQEYLPAYLDIFSRPLSVMAGTCLIYLNSEQDMALSAESLSDPGDLTNNMPFLRDCSVYWGGHVETDVIMIEHIVGGMLDYDLIERNPLSNDC